MALLYDLRFVPAGLSVLVTLLHAFGVLYNHRRVAQPLKACQLLRIVLSFAVVVVFATLTVFIEINIWTVYLLGSIVAVSMIMPLDEQDVAISTWVITLAPAHCVFTDSPGFLFGGIIIADVYAYHGSTFMLVSAAIFRLWVACEWMVYSQKKHRTKGCVFMEAFLLSIMVLAGAMGITCAKDWRLLPVIRLYMLLIISVGYGVEDLLVAALSIRYQDDDDE
ncbi:hypothetical protein PG999_009978 [Apiospora kogelbergensis]|uniref:Uncharacterized protein n=1 Tax=Apiospora kogelbergensis TaxID=1337665 RepID=A0AAW0QS92_9PEZI